MVPFWRKQQGSASPSPPHPMVIPPSVHMLLSKSTTTPPLQSPRKGLTTGPSQSIVRCNKRFLMGKSLIAILSRVKAILALFDDELFDVTEATRSIMPVVVG